MQTKDRATERNHYKVNKEAAEPPSRSLHTSNRFPLSLFLSFFICRQFLSSLIKMQQQNIRERERKEKKNNLVSDSICNFAGIRQNFFNQYSPDSIIRCCFFLEKSFEGLPDWFFFPQKWLGEISLVGSIYSTGRITVWLFVHYTSLSIYKSHCYISHRYSNHTAWLTNKKPYTSNGNTTK